MCRRAVISHRIVPGVVDGSLGDVVLRRAVVVLPAAAESEVVHNAESEAYPLEQESQEYTLEKIVVVAMLAYDIWLFVVLVAVLVETGVNDLVIPRASRLSPSRGPII